ncbi:MAG TPA: S24/S26 family peptidase [Mycobacteriales bacterium]|nr:S24/S26 family peptidase [Mycobacteriales bacterium]
MRIGTALGRVLVKGPSMVPTLYDGDHLLVGRGWRVRPGDLVIARFRTRPELVVVKRAVAPEDGGWRLVSDNPYATGPEGVADVEARVVLRYRKGPR